MSKIVFFCIPAHGHTNPTLPVVRELISRGHSVRYYSYNSMRDKIISTGAEFISCDNYDMEQKLTPEDSARLGKDLAFSTHVITETTLALDDKICSEMREYKPDCIVSDSMAIWGRAAALKLNIPFVSSTTTFAFNKYSSRVIKQSTANLLKMIFSLPRINKDVKRLRDKGYPIKNILDIIANNDDTHTIVYTSPVFQPYSETFSDKYSFVGPILRESAETVEKTRNKLIYISMGTVNNNMPDFYNNCIHAFKDSEYQVIISSGNCVSLDNIGALPFNISIYPFVDQIAVLQKADLFISHCGMNSVSESLYHSVPLLMFPQTPEQNGVANRVLELSSGIRMDKIDAISIKRYADSILKNDNYRLNANLISDSFKRCGGVKEAADKILGMCIG